MMESVPVCRSSHCVQSVEWEGNGCCKNKLGLFVSKCQNGAFFFPLGVENDDAFSKSLCVHNVGKKTNLGRSSSVGR